MRATRPPRQPCDVAFVTCVVAFSITCATAFAPRAATAQSASVWIDLDAAHSRPPAGAALDPSTYGMLGARLRVDGTGSSLELGGTAGRGTDAGGLWLLGRGTYDAYRTFGRFDIGVTVEGSGLTYASPLRTASGDEYTQTLVHGSVRPRAGVSIAGALLRAEARYTRGAWRSEVRGTAVPRPGLPIPGRDPLQPIVRDEGPLEVRGAAVSLLRVFGPATLELRAARYDADNQVVSGRFSGVDANVAFALGPLDAMLGAQRWDTPVAGSETGWHAGIGFAAGDVAYVRAIASRSVSDPLYGAAGSAGVSVGVSMRLGSHRVGGAPTVAVGDDAGRGRTVRFRLDAPDAHSVAVAGDFSGWERRALQRQDGGVWVLETVIEPGVYHFAYVIDGATWHVPDDAPGIVDDGWGRRNATLVVQDTNEGRRP